MINKITTYEAINNNSKTSKEPSATLSTADQALKIYTSTLIKY